MDRVIERGHVRGPLDGGMPAQGHDAGAGTAEVAEQELQQRGAADDLRTVGVLRPRHRIGERGRLVGSRVIEQCLGHPEERLLGAARHALHHLGRVAREVMLDDLEHAPRVLQ